MLALLPEPELADQLVDELHDLGVPDEKITLRDTPLSVSRRRLNLTESDVLAGALEGALLGSLGAVFVGGFVSYVGMIGVPDTATALALVLICCTYGALAGGLSGLIRPHRQLLAWRPMLRDEHVIVTFTARLSDETLDVLLDGVAEEELRLKTA